MVILFTPVYLCELVMPNVLLPWLNCKELTTGEELLSFVIKFDGTVALRISGFFLTCACS